jgi:hypothetical protein
MIVMKEDINVLKNGWLTDNVTPLACLCRDAD